MVALPARQCDRNCASTPPETRELAARPAELGKQNRRQSLAAVHGGLVGRTPGLEELNQLLARAVVVPFAIALDDLQQVIDGLLPLPLAVQREREIEARLMVERIGRYLGFE